MNQIELQTLVEEISLKEFGEPFLHQAIFNARLRTTGGRYHLRTHHLDFNPEVWMQMGETGLIGVIKHELCHYHLHLNGKGYRHGDKDFKDLLAKVGGLRHVPPFTPTVYKCFYKCSSCPKIYKRKRRINTRKYVCGSCKGKLVEIKES